LASQTEPRLALSHQDQLALAFKTLQHAWWLMFEMRCAKKQQHLLQLLVLLQFCDKIL
jgi:hypothetical protein